MAKLKKLRDEEGQDPEAVLLQSVERGWKGLFAVKDDQGPRGGRGEPKEYVPRGPTIDEFLARRGGGRGEPKEYVSRGPTREEYLAVLKERGLA